MEKLFNGKISDQIFQSITVKTRLLENCVPEIERCGKILAKTLQNGGKILFCGNGGSAADSQHIAAELVVRLRSTVERPALPGLALTVDTSILTAGGNDYGFDNVFARGVEAYGKEGDALVGISTSGNSENVIRAVKEASQRDITTVCLLGGSGGKLAAECDDKVIVPSESTARIQESHILIGHIWCEMIEEMLFPEQFRKD